MSQVKTAAELAALPDGSKVKFRGKHLVFVLTKQNGIWADTRLSVTNVELEAVIDNVTFGKKATVLQP